MVIKITKEMSDIPSWCRPRVGKKFYVEDIKEAAYKPTENNIKVVECRGQLISVLASECEVVS